jgi:hypothetical protein
LLFEGDKKIYGIDASQAKLLAVSFVKSLLGERKLLDKDGATVSIDYR